MSQKLFIAIFIFIMSTLLGCNSAPPEIVQSQIKTDDAPSATPDPYWGPPEIRNEIQLPADGSVQFKGVSFSYNQTIWREIKVEDAAESPIEQETDKPYNEHSQHLYFSLKDLKRDQTTDVKIFPVDGFPRAFAVSRHYVNVFNEQLGNLKKAIKNKNFRVNNEIPLIYFGDGGQELEAKVKHFSFQNGKGILFITHWNYEMALMSNENLEYVFAGLTSDGKYYVLARMPVSAAFLPDNSPPEFEGFKERDIYKEDKATFQRYKKYNLSIKTRLENLPPEKFEPNLKSFEEIISTLKIEK